jgi:DNA invertase Pin-like site-specific DNA recombinase
MGPVERRPEVAKQVYLRPYVNLFGFAQTFPPRSKFICKLYFPFLQRNIPPKAFSVNGRNVALISFGEGLDFSTSMGKLFYQLSGAFAEFERDCIRDRVRAGMRNARAAISRMVFTVLGAVAELERSLIAERVRAGLRNTRAKGKRLGRPRVAVDARRIGALRASGSSWAEITRQTGWTKGTVHRAFYAQNACLALPKNG